MIRTLTTITLLLVPGLTLARPQLSQEHVAQIERGDVLEFSQKSKGTKVMTGKAIGIIKDVPEAVLYVLVGLDKYKHFVPRVTESRITRQKGWDTYAVINTDLPWPVKDCWAYIKLTRQDKAGRVYEAEWSMINGTMKSYRGSALIEPWSKDGKRTVITYKLLFEPQGAAPDSMISEGVRTVASTMALSATSMSLGP